MNYQAAMGEAFSEDDLLTLTKEISDGQTVKSEDFYNDVYLDEIIDKPWGLEYRVSAGWQANHRPESEFLEAGGAKDGGRLAAGLNREQ
jgi:hypothetical protein